MDKTDRVSMNLFLLLVWTLFFPIFCYFLYQYIPLSTLGDFGKDNKLLLLILVLVFYFSVMNSLHNSTQIDDNDDEEEIITEDNSVDVLLETKKHEGKIFTFSANFTKVPAVDDVLVVYSDDEDDYVEFLVSDVQMATNLPGGESYLVKGQVIGLGQEKLEEYGWEEK